MLLIKHKIISKTLFIFLIILCVTAGLPSYRPSRRVYASRSAGVLSNKVVTSGNNKGWALWVTKLYYKLISLQDYLRKGNKCSYILNASFVLTLECTSLIRSLDPIKSIIA